MTIKEHLESMLPNHNIEIDEDTYPGSIIIYIDNISFPLLAKTNNFNALWKTLQTYCFSFADCLDGDEQNIDKLINEILRTEIDNTDVNEDDLDNLADAIEKEIDNNISDCILNNSVNVHTILNRLALAQKIADELTFSDAAKSLHLNENPNVDYVLHDQRCYNLVAFSLVNAILDEYETMDIYGYLDESPEALGELIKDAIEDVLEGEF